MKLQLARVSIFAAWLCIFSWFIRYEAFPELFTHTSSGYTSLLSSDLLIMDSWMKISLNGNPIGYTHTSVDVNPGGQTDYYVIDNNTHLKLNFMQHQQHLNVHSKIFLDTMSKLQRFSFSLSSHNYSLQMTAKRLNGQQYQIVMKTGTSSVRSELTLPDDVVIYSPVTEAALKRLKPGQHLKIKMFNPATMSQSQVIVKALRKEILELSNTRHDTTVLSSDYHGLNILTWVDSSGNVQKQSTSIGWTLEKCTPRDAMAVVRSTSATEDILAVMAVKCVGTIRSPRKCKKLKLRLRGVSFTEKELLTNRQSPQARKANEILLTVRAAKLPSNDNDVFDSGELSTNMLSPTASIQSDHPDIVARANLITSNMRTPIEKSRAIFRWVHKNVAKLPTISLPSSLDVLRRMEGDCNEHTYLFVALARAACIPSRIVIGLAYHRGAFYYHAWPSVYLDGAWLEMDPTWGQETVDATHIAFATGEIASQLKITKMIGQLEIEVLEETEHD